MRISQKDIDKFNRFESLNDIQCIQYKKNDLWPIIRYAVFNYIASDILNASDQLLYQTKNNVSKKFRYFLRSFQHCKSLLYIFGKTDIILFDGARNINIDGNMYNPTTYAFVRSLSDKYSITIIDMHGLVDNQSYPGIKVIDISWLLGITRYLSRYLFKKKWNACMQVIEGNIYSYFNKHANLKLIYSNVYIHQYVISLFTKLIINNKKPKAMIYSDNGSLSMAIKTARASNLVTIDYQHSIISKLNHLYAHPDGLSSNSKSYLSEIIMSYGTYWSKYFENYYKVLPVGSFQQERALIKAESVKKDNNCVTIVSGMKISRNILVKIALFIAQKFPKIKIFYKLRQEEYDVWSNNYPEEMKRNKNIVFVDNETRELHYYLKKSEYVIGINSTVLIEALPLSKVIVIKHGWYGEMIEFIESGVVLEARDCDDVFRIIKSNAMPSHKLRTSDIYKNEVDKNIRSSIERLI